MRGALARDHPDRRAVHRRDGRAEPFGPVVPGYEPLPDDARRERAAALLPILRGLASTDRPQVGHFSDDGGRPRLPGARRAPAAGRARARPARTTSCAPRSGRWCWTCRRPRRSRTSIARLEELHEAYRADYRGVLRASRRAGQPGHARRRPGDRARAGRRHVLVRRQQADRAGGRRVLRQRHQRHARRRGALHLRPDPRVGEVPHRVLGARGGQARAAAGAQAARDPRRPGDRRRVRHRQGDRASPRGRGGLRRRRRHRRDQRERRRRASSAAPTSRSR